MEASRKIFSEGDSTDQRRKRMVDLHNEERSRFKNTPPLSENPDLTKKAQSWANQMLQARNLKHSGTKGVGENISYFYTSAGPVETNELVRRLYKGWLEEKEYFKPGIFPDCKTDKKETVGHYTQIIWPSTKEIGVGIAFKDGVHYCCCMYTPAGNMKGKLLDPTLGKISEVEDSNEDNNEEEAQIKSDDDDQVIHYDKVEKEEQKAPERIECRFLRRK